MTTSDTPDYSNHAFDPSEIGNTIHQHKMLQNQVRPEAVSNTPFEEVLQKAFMLGAKYQLGADFKDTPESLADGAFKTPHNPGGMLLAELTQLHKAAIVDELEHINNLNLGHIKSGMGAEDLKRVFERRVAKLEADRIEQYKKEGR